MTTLSRAALALLLTAACSPDAYVLDFAAASAPDAGAGSFDYCLDVPPLAGPPRLDGVIDDGLPLMLIPTATFHFEDDTAGSPPADFAARLAVAWRPDGLYVFFDVVDPDRWPAPADRQVWFGDGVEIYVDDDGRFANPPQYDNPGTRHLLYGEPPSGSTGARVEHTTQANDPSTPWPMARALYTANPGGYVVEAFVRAADLGLPTWDLAADALIGFDASVNVSHPAPIPGVATMRMGSYALRAAEGQPAAAGFPFNTVQAFCTPTLRRTR